MSERDPESRTVQAAVTNCYSTWSESYYRDYYQSDAAYPAVHSNIVRQCLGKEGSRTLLDAGCGPASMLRDLDGLGLDRFGFDLTPEMVAEARRILSAQGVAESNIWQGSVLEQGDFCRPGAPARYDATLCFGVLPHIPPSEDERVLRNLAGSLRKGGLLMVEARNQLFALFSLNRYSRDLFMDTLVRLPQLKQAAGEEEKAHLDEAIQVIEQRFRMDLPQVRKGKADAPGYDEVLSRTHNPFELRAAAERTGLRDVSVLFYHYHCLPPMVEPLVPGLFRRASVALEDPLDWRGHFMASALILKGYRAEL